MSWLGLAAIAGIDPLPFLYSDDEVEIEFLTIVANKAIEAQHQLYKGLAREIIQQLGIALGGK